MKFLLLKAGERSRRRRRTRNAVVKEAKLTAKEAGGPGAPVEDLHILLPTKRSVLYDCNHFVGFVSFLWI